MKNSIICFVLVPLLISFIAACGKESVKSTIEWTAVNLKIHAIDADGNELMNPDNQYFIGDELVLYFRGNSYVYERNAESDTTSLCLTFKEQYSRNFLIFGPIDGAMDYDEDIIIRFITGGSWIIHYYCANHDEISLHCDREWYFNGSKTANPIFLKPKTD